LLLDRKEPTTVTVPERVDVDPATLAGAIHTAA